MKVSRTAHIISGLVPVKLISSALRTVERAPSAATTYLLRIVRPRSVVTDTSLSVSEMETAFSPYRTGVLRRLRRALSTSGWPSIRKLRCRQCSRLVHQWLWRDLKSPSENVELAARHNVRVHYVNDVPINSSLLHLRPLGKRSSRIPTTSRYCWVRAFMASARPNSRGPGLASIWDHCEQPVPSLLRAELAEERRTNDAHRGPEMLA